MTTADASFITSDTTCITADGLSRCHQHEGNSKGDFVGPGFFIFFQHDKEIGGGASSTLVYESKKIDRIKEDDEEILLLMRIIIGGNH